MKTPEQEKRERKIMWLMIAFATVGIPLIVLLVSAVSAALN